jgi:hypothetical protein
VREIWAIRDAVTVRSKAGDVGHFLCLHSHRSSVARRHTCCAAAMLGSRGNVEATRHRVTGYALLYVAHWFAVFISSLSTI